MDPLLQFLFGMTLAIILHELTHLIVILYYRIPFKAIVLTKWSALGFLVDNETYVTDNKKLFFLYFSPMIWCLVYFINPSEPFYLMFPIVNIFGGIGDFYNFFRIMLIPADKRIEYANGNDDKVLKKIIWRKDISSGRFFNSK
jgi:hypothetical protein